MAQVGLRAVPWVSSGQLSPSQARSWALTYSTPTSTNLKLLGKHRNWDLQFLTAGLAPGCIFNIKKIFVAPQVTMKSCPAKPFIHTQVSTGRRPRYAGSWRGLQKIPDRDQVPEKGKCSLAWIQMELPWGQQDSTVTQYPDVENLLQSQSWFWVFSNVIISL